MEQVVVRDTFLFCTPAQKVADGTVTRIHNPAAHLTWYLLSLINHQPVTRQVILSNQFGANQAWTLDIPFALAVPTRDAERRATVPAGLDHFKCYGVSGGTPLGISVLLRDQFGGEPVTVLAPFAFCNPVAKTHAGVVTPIQDASAHLACYFLTSRNPLRLRTVTILNQFQAQPAEVLLDRTYAVCVPSAKVSWRVVA